MVLNLLLFQEVSLQWFFPSFSDFPDLKNKKEAFEEKEALRFIILRTKQTDLHFSFEELNESKTERKKH